MASNLQSSSNRWQDWVNLIIAAWLFISPWALQVSPEAAMAWNAWAFAVVVGVFSIVALVRAQPWEEWINLIVGAWLFISPWALGFLMMTNVTANFMIVGALIFLLAVWDLYEITNEQQAYGQR